MKICDSDDLANYSCEPWGTKNPNLIGENEGKTQPQNRIQWPW